MYTKGRGGGDPIEIKEPEATHRNQEPKPGRKGESWMKKKRSRKTKK